MKVTKEHFKNILSRIGLLGIARSVIYRCTEFDADTTHPRRLMRRFYSQLIKKGDLCFDIGAHTGNRTGMFLELGAKVICVEPQTECLKQLYESFGRNRSVIILGKGLADRDGFLDLSVCMEAPTLSTMSAEFKDECERWGNHWRKTEKVSVITLDALIARYGIPDFCKIDVENFEEKVLMGLTKPIPLLSFEFNSIFLDNMRRCCGRLSSIGNYKFNFAISEPTGGRSFELSEWVYPDRLYKELTIVKEKHPGLWGDIYARL